jgi:hypothetical protein
MNANLDSIVGVGKRRATVPDRRWRPLRDRVRGKTLIASQDEERRQCFDLCQFQLARGNQKC